MIKKAVTLLVLYAILFFIYEALCLQLMVKQSPIGTALYRLRVTPACAQSLAGPNIIDHNCTDISKIPLEWIEEAKANLHIAYQHASHGRQILEGMKGLDAFMGNTGLYALSTDGIDRGSAVLDIADGWWYSSAPTVDRITNSDDWVLLTRALLDDPANTDINVIMWSWCNIVHYPNGTTEPAVAYDVERYYIPYMEILIREYGPGGSKIESGERITPVTFVFMTGHSNFGTVGKNKVTFDANKKIREHCISHNRILYDFYDIECYDPDGRYFGDGEANTIDYGQYQEGCGHGIHNLHEDTSYASDPCRIWENRASWGIQWQNWHTEGVDYYSVECPHCQEVPVLANLKAYAMWWMVASLAGWEPGTTTSTVNSMDSDNDGVLNSSDNCPSIPNPTQDDTYPPAGNGIGDACDCEGDFDHDGDCDATDAVLFKLNFGRSTLNNSCESDNPCYGDFNCDGDSDGDDAILFKEDFGRNSFQNSCPIYEIGNWCTYPPSTSTTTSIPPTTTTTTSIPPTTTTTSIPLEICDDSIDNDMDGITDCNDPDCLGLCGNNICDPCEDCLGCPEDCVGLRLGKLSERFCCGDGIQQNSEEDGTICDGNY